MPSRIWFVFTIAVVASSLTTFAAGSGVQCPVSLHHAVLTIPEARPRREDRKWVSPAVDGLIANFTARMKDKDLAALFSNCYPNALDTTAVVVSLNDSFVITGDIDAMWLRDATNQVMPYISLVAEDPALVLLFTGLVKRELRSLLISTYADAWNYDANGRVTDPYDFRKPPMLPTIFEGKYELDQLAAAMKLTFETWSVLKDTGNDIFADNATVGLWVEAFGAISETVLNQTLDTAEQNGSYPYEFRRAKWPWPHPDQPTVYPHDEVSWTGMARSAFRPSDDLCVYDFLVPSNAMMLVELNHTLQMLTVMAERGQISADEAALLAQTTSELMDSITFGISFFGVTNSSSGTTILAYEVDGFGGVNAMDDANVPSLLSLPVIGYQPEHYAATRDWILSFDNPWFFNGSCGCGVGSPHTGPGRVWPMSVMMRGLTANTDSEVLDALHILKLSANGTGFMHESFNVNNVSDFTRPWFAWANTMFGQLILHVATTRPHLIF